MAGLYRMMKMMVCIGLATALIGCAATPKSESTGQYIDDSTITTKVKAALFDELSLKTFQIGVKTYKGRVQLNGFVNSRNDVEKAGEIARSVSGVVSVKNDLIIK
ncbi:MAG: BON domain-containing protein [Desulfosalsimonadaceae bacterium]